MKNKLRFIMPRLITATVVAGLAALIITTLFKLLLGLTLIAGVITLAARAMGRHRRHQGIYQQDSIPGLGDTNAFNRSRAWASPVYPVTGYATTKGTSIVPIN